MNTAQIAQVENLRVHYGSRSGRLFTPAVLRAVDGVSLNVEAGEAVAVVGESGSGKTTLARGMLGMERQATGQVRIGDIDVLGVRSRRLSGLRRLVQPVYQDPYTNVDPRMRVRAAIAEPLRIAGEPKRIEDQAVDEVMAAVGLSRSLRDSYPRELSGGQLQRVAIARALILRPQLVILDEPTSALDVSVQAQILNLLSELKLSRGLAYLLISHDLQVVRYLADRIYVMYRGVVVESGTTDHVVSKPCHPYTKMLLASTPKPRWEVKHRVAVAPDVSDPVVKNDAVTGCRFVPRCTLWRNAGRPSICINRTPELREANQGNMCACHLSVD